jgi:hypothetical protein
MPARLWRYLRCFLRAVLGLLGFALFLWLVLFVINRFDDRIDAQTAAWLSYPAPAANPDKNGYFLYLAIDSQASDPVAAARAWLKAAHQLASDSSQSVDAHWKAFDALEKNILMPASISAPGKVGCRQGCYEDILSHRLEFKGALQEYALPIGRFEQMLDLPEYAEDGVIDYTIPIQFKGPYNADRLYCGRMVLELETGQVELAYHDWGRRQAFWSRAATGAGSLLGQMIAIGALRRGDQFLVDMLVRHPETVMVARREALPLFDDEIHRRIAAQFPRVMTYELQYEKSAWPLMSLNEWWRHYNQPVPILDANNPMSGLQGLLWLSLYQSNASLNFERALLEDELSRYDLSLDGKPFKPHLDERQLCDRLPARGWLSPRNLGGKVLACASYGGFAHYIERVNMLGSVNRQIAAVLATHTNPEAFQALAADLAPRWQQM